MYVEKRVVKSCTNEEDNDSDDDGGRAEKGRNGNLPRNSDGHATVTMCHTCFGRSCHAL